MKTIKILRLCIPFVFAIGIVNICLADVVDSLTAKTVALNFYSSKSSKQISNFELVYTEKADDNTPVYYVFNVNEKDGFVIISADDAAIPVIGYSFDKKYDLKNKSPEFAYWMKGYKKQILSIRRKELSATSKTKVQWDFYNQVNFNRTQSTSPIIVWPLLEQTEWAQSPWYNEQCPVVIPYQRPPVGCVATAMGQIMKYWNYPAHGVGTTPAYETTQTPIYSIPSVDLSLATYDWSNIPNSINESSSSIQKNEISQLLYHCGISVTMNYGYQSYAHILSYLGIGNSAEKAFPRNFGYNSSTIDGIRRNLSYLILNPEWISSLKTELDEGRPIIYGGTDNTGPVSGGHAWVCDGYGEDNVFHMNWGWGGSNNAFFYIDLLNTLDVGGYEFDDHQALIGIQPDCKIADLLIAEKTVNSYNLISGTTATISCKEKNSGHISAGTNSVKLYLSNTSTLNLSTAVYLGLIPVTSVSALSQTSTLSAQVSIPANTSSGQYWLFFYADADEVINECYENNNFASVVLNITSSSCTQPGNDGCTGNFAATPLTFGTSCNSIPSTSCGATSSGFNACAGNADDDVFFKFIPTTANATVKVSSTAGYDAVFQLLTGPCGTAMQQVAPGCINSTGIGGVETQSYSGLITGNTYFIRVWHAGAGWGSGNFSICVYGNACTNPGASSPLSPGNAALPGQIINTTTPQFSWTNATGATKYTVRISKEPYGLNNIVYTSPCTSSPLTIPAGILENGSNYRWDVEALYACGSSCSSMSADYYFTVSTASCVAPATQASAIIFPGISNDQMGISWTNGNGNRRIVKINTTNTFTPPVDGVSITANSNYAGTGEQVVYDGSGGSVLVTGLTPGTNYCFRVYEANCSGSLSMYNITSASNNPACQATAATACITPTIQASNISFSNIGTNTIAVNWSAGNGSRRVLKINTINSFTAPADGTVPTANSIYNGSGEQVIYNGTGNSITVSGLTAGTNYCFRAYEAKCSGTQTLYNTTTASNNPNCQSTSSSCIAPDVPVSITGNASCPGTGIGSNSFALKWSKVGSSKYDIEIRQFPYEPANIVHTQYCITDTVVTINNPTISAGKLYSWRVRSTSDCNTCWSNWSEAKYFHKPPSVSPTGNINICNGDGVLLTAPMIYVQSPIVLSYQWYKFIDGINDQPVGNDANTYFVNSSGSYYVKLIYTGATICNGNNSTDASNSVNANIGYIPAAPVLSSNSPVQQGSDLVLSASTPVTGTNIFFWSGPNGFASSNASNTISSVGFNATGTYSCYLVNNGCESAVGTVSVYVISPSHNAYRYWFDNSFANAVTVDAGTGSNIILQQNISVSQINDGLHTLHAQFFESTGKWSSISSSFFYKPQDIPTGTSEYEYWFDNDYQNKTSVNNTSTNNFVLLNDFATGSLAEGLHSLNIRFKPDGKAWSSIVSSFFYKANTDAAGQAQYEYWFDDNYAGKQVITISSTGNMILLDSLNTGTISNGLHTLHFRSRPDGKTWSVVTSSFFYKSGDALTPVNNLASYICWIDNNWQNPYTITITGVSNLNWTLNLELDSLVNGQHSISQAFKDDRGKWSSIVTDNFTKVSVTSPACQYVNREFASGVIAGAGATYQWQVDNGTGYTDLTGSPYYSGINNDTLHLLNVPTTWYGYKYRCIVTSGGTTYTGPVYLLKFIMKWTGSVDNAWNNAANWNCNAVPDENTDVLINAGLPRYPQVGENAACRSLYLQPGTSLDVLPGKKLDITGINQ